MEGGGGVCLFKKSCHNKFPQALRAKREMSSLTVLEGSSLKSSGGEPLSQLLVAASDPGYPLACSCVILDSAVCSRGALPVCLMSGFPSSYTVPVTGLEAIHKY